MPPVWNFRKSWPLPLLALSLLFAAAGCDRLVRGQRTPEGYEFRPGSPRGSGKFYMGREIARTIDHTGAMWLERPSREAEELPGRLVQVLGLRPTDIVADLGAGTGYFTFRIAPQTPQGKVYAVDIDAGMLDFIRARADSLGLANVTPVRGSEKSPNLPPGEIDLALIVDAYHEFSYPYEMMQSVREALRPGGRVVLVEYRAEDATIPIHTLHRMSEEQARRELVRAGFTWERTLRVLPQQHIIIFTKP